MRIGLDLSVIQTPHRMRGIGATAINFVNNMPEDLKKQHTFVIYLYKDEQEAALELLDLSGMNYTIQNLQEAAFVKLTLPGRLNIINGMLSNFQKVLNIFSGDPRIQNLDNIDAFLQFDQMAPLPKAKHIKTALILYDIIPYVMEADYLWTYRTARRHSDSRKSAVRKHVHRYLYKFKTRAIAKSADVLIAISQHTKDDFIKHLGIKTSRIEVVHLGISQLPISANDKTPEFKEYLENSWGYFPKPINLTDKPFLLFVGGADPRRKLNDLVAAFNNLRAEGKNIRLVFAGDTMKGPHAIPIIETQKYIASSSYLDDIVFLGFVDENQKAWLYQNTMAFIYPSIYEGFGLPVLEAMQYGAPVITYSNSSITEIVGDAAITAKSFLDIKNNVDLLLNDINLRKNMSNQGIQHAKNFSWETTAKNFIATFER